MQSTDSKRSWWRRSDFARALDDAEDYSPYDALAARVAQLEKRVMELEPAKRADGDAGSPRNAAPDLLTRVHFQKPSSAR
jgi:hypothetical protein